MDQQNERIDIMEMNEENKSAESSKTGISFPEKVSISSMMLEVDCMLKNVGRRHTYIGL